MTTLVNQPFSSPSSNTNQNVTNETWFGQYQLRGSILVIKDNLNTASGYMAFGTDMTTIPTSPTTGTGIYVDYRGLYGNAGGVQQFFLQSSDGKAYAGAGNVTLDVNGIFILSGAGAANQVTWVDAASPTQAVGSIYVSKTGTTRFLNVGAQAKATSSDVDAVSDLYASLNGGATTHIRAYARESDLTMWAQITGNTVTGLQIGSLLTSSTPPSSLLHLSSTAPTFRMEDTTASAKDLLVTVDANLAKFQEAAGTDILTLDLANARVGIGNAAPANPLDVTGIISSTSYLRLGGSTTAKNTMRAVTALAANGVAQVTDAAADISLIMVLSSDGSSAIFATKGGAHATALVGTGGTYSVTAGTAGTNVYWSVGNARYEIENKTAGALTYQIFEFLVG